jgi:hypothetical protein
VKVDDEQLVRVRWIEIRIGTVEPEGRESIAVVREEGGNEVSRGKSPSPSGIGVHKQKAAAG